MKPRRVVGLVLALALGFADAAAAQDEAPRPQRRTFQVDGVAREALVVVPKAAAQQPSPLVFVFHGHGGSSAAVARSFALHSLWPEAIVVYPQGLPTATARDPDGERSGWQNRPGVAGDRDLHFVDTVLTTLRAELRVDPNRIHATGHSNGGGFTYLLLGTRGDVFASFAPSAATAGGKLRGASLVARPVLHLAGRADEVVPFAQQERSIAALVRARGAAATSEAWDAVPGARLHRAADGGHVATWLHDGGHAFPEAAPAAIVAFFKATPRSLPWVPPVVVADGVQRLVLTSAAAGTEVGCHVWTPPQYAADPNLRLPVVYWLHGSGGGESGIAVVAAQFASAIARGVLPPVLVVFPNGLANGMWCDSHDGSQPVETIVVDELVPHVERTFRTRTTRQDRLLVGFSMGGYGALRLGMRHHERFATMVSLGGGPLQPELVATPRADEARRLQVLRTVYGGDMVVFTRCSPWQLAEEHRESLRSSRLLLAVGDADETLPANRSMHERLATLGIAHAWHELPGVAHDPRGVLTALGDRLWTFLAESLPAR